jgi:phage replication O-like protein O
MPSLSATEWKVLCFIIRKTIGWQKTREQLSYTQIIKGTGIKSPVTISKALKKLTRRRYVRATPGGDWETVTYWLNTSLEVKADDDPIASENEAMPALDFEAMPASENEGKATYLASFSEDTKQNQENKTQNIHTQRPLRAPGAPAERVCVDIYPEKTYERYAFNHPTEIRNAIGWASTARRTGEWNERVARWCEEHGIDPCTGENLASASDTSKQLPISPRQCPPECPKCFGGGMEVVPGKGARRCPNLSAQGQAAA